MKMIALYERVSTLHQAEEGYSIDEQQERLRLFAKAHEWTVVKEYTDPGFSGGKLDRPGIQMLIRDAKAHLFDAVLVYKLDRLSRSQKDTLYLIEDVFNANGVGLISMCENFDTQTAFGQAMIGILSVFAQLERGQITERMTMGRIGRAKAGYFSGGSKAPIGYRYVRSEGHKRNTLVVDDYEAVQVKEVFDTFLHTDMTLKEICRRMHGKYTNKYGDWSHVSTVSRMLRDRVYIGEVSFGGQWYSGIHTPIIDKVTFDAVQSKYNRYLQTTAGTFSQNFEGNHLLTGLVRCGICGSRYFVKSWNHTLKDGTRKHYERYACYTATNQNKKMVANVKCNNIKIPVAQLDEYITSEVRKLALDPGLVRRVSSSRPHEDNAVQSLQKRIEELSRQEEKLIDLYQIGTLDLEAVRKRADSIKAEKEKLLRSINIEEEKSSSLHVEDAIEKLQSFSAVFSEGSLQERHAFICSIIDEVVVFPDRVEIHWAFAAK